MSTIDIGIGHDDNTMISSFPYIKGISDTTTNGGDKIFYLFIDKYFINAGLFCVENLSSKWENGLKFSITTLLRRASC